MAKVIRKAPDLKGPFKQHTIGSSGACRLCLRDGAELKAGPCPGYQTAAEYIDWLNAKRQAPKKGKKK